MIKAKDIAKFLDSSFLGEESLELNNVDDIKGKKENALSFISEEKYLKFLSNSNAKCFIVERNLKDKIEDKNKSFIFVNKAYFSFIKVINNFFLKEKVFNKNPKQNISENAVIYPNVYLGDKVKIGEGTIIYPGSVILDNTSVGKNSSVLPNAVIFHDVKIGNNVTIGASSVIGGDGFGFIEHEDLKIKIPHLGSVIIEDNVEIGSNTSIDRGTLLDTVISKGTKIDNLVQVGHNCEIGENGVLCGMVGLSGSTKLGKNVIMAANSGTKGHMKIGDGCVVTARTSVSKDLPSGKTVKGYPARELNKELKIQTLLGKLPEIYKKLLKLEKEKK
jgi:UDP-3-O-[3-hydroxymyristoyl] glucosamine N-acyltransferase